MTHRALSWPLAANAEGHFSFGISCHGSHEPVWPNQADLDHAGFARRSRRCPLDRLPPTDLAMHAIGQRLGRSCSERELTALATRGSDLLARLHPRERASLAGYLRFSVDQPVIVDVAVPRSSTPFWIADQGFRATNLVLENPDTTWQIYRKRFPPDRSAWASMGSTAPRSHTMPFSSGHKETASRHTFASDARAVKYWKPVTASRGVARPETFTSRSGRSLPS